MRLNRRKTHKRASNLACFLVGNSGTPDNEHPLPPHMRRKRPSYKEACRVKEEMMGSVSYDDLKAIEADGSVLRTACSRTPGYFHKQVFNDKGELCKDIMVPLGHIEDARLQANEEEE